MHETDSVREAEQEIEYAASFSDPLGRTHASRQHLPDCLQTFAAAHHRKTRAYHVGAVPAVHHKSASHRDGSEQERTVAGYCTPAMQSQVVDLVGPQVLKHQQAK